MPRIWHCHMDSGQGEEPVVPVVPSSTHLREKGEKIKKINKLKLMIIINYFLLIKKQSH